MSTALMDRLLRETDSPAADAAGVAALFLMLLAALSLPGLF